MTTSSQTQFMAVLAAAEHVTAASPVAPDSITQRRMTDLGFIPGTHEYRLGVELHFSSVDEVHAFAEALHVAVARRPHGDAQMYTHADGVLNEVPFRAWALSAVESPSAVAA